MVNMSKYVKHASHWAKPQFNVQRFSCFFCFGRRPPHPSGQRWLIHVRWGLMRLPTWNTPNSAVNKTIQIHVYAKVERRANWPLWPCWEPLCSSASWAWPFSSLPKLKRFGRPEVAFERGCGARGARVLVSSLDIGSFPAAAAAAVGTECGCFICWRSAWRGFTRMCLFCPLERLIWIILWNQS